MSYATIHASIVLAACKKFLKERKSRIAAEREEAIAEAMKPTLIFRRRRTRAQAIEYLQQPGAIGFSTWDNAELCGGAEAYRIKELAALAQIASAHAPIPLINLDTEAAKDLEGYL